MSVFKKIDVNDNSITPFNVYKDYDITPSNYTGSGGNGVQFLSGLFHSHSFGDPINGVHINDEVKNLKSISKEKKLLLSEIFFFQDSSISIEEKSKKIIESINEIGFKNTANIYSSSDSAKLGGNIGWVEEKELSKIILIELNKIDVGQITRPIKLDNNFLILKIEDIKTESSSFNEKQLTNKILQNETDRQLKLFSRNYFNRVKINLNISEI